MIKKKFSSLLLLSVFSTISSGFVNAQTSRINRDSIKISTKPFSDGVNHWYKIKDKNNIVNPIPNQPQYKESEFEKIADNIILFQKDNGGWPKNYDMRAILTKEQVQEVLKYKSYTNTTFDNGTTYTHIEYLAEVFTITQDKKYKIACYKGLEFILEAQYSNGGWPQFYPLEKGYSRRVTFNDGAYIGVMGMLKRIAENDYIFSFLDDEFRATLIKAFNRGIDGILATQIEDSGQLTAWCQQYDEATLEPAWARKFEPPSICNGESVGVIQFLMSMDKPNERVIDAIQGAVRWFEDSKIYNSRVEKFDIPATDSNFKTIKKDVRVVHDPSAPPIWARFYEIGSHRPMFCNRDTKIVYSLAEVDLERREGYAWYTNQPEKVLKAYPAWQKRWAPANNVLKN